MLRERASVTNSANSIENNSSDECIVYQLGKIKRKGECTMNMMWKMEMVLTPLCGAKIMNLFDKSKYFCIFFPKIAKIGYLAL